MHEHQRWADLIPATSDPEHPEPATRPEAAIEPDLEPGRRDQIGALISGVLGRFTRSEGSDVDRTFSERRIDSAVEMLSKLSAVNPRRHL